MASLLYIATFQLPTVAWIGFAAILPQLADGAIDTAMPGLVVGLTLLAHFLLSLYRVSRQAPVVDCFSRHRRAGDLCYPKLNQRRKMLAAEQDDSTYRVRYQSYLLSMVFLALPPAMLYEFGPKLLDGSIDTGELAGMCLGILLPLLAAYYYTEFASFTFSTSDGLFRWRWSNLVTKKSGAVPLSRIAGVRRDALEASESSGLHYVYRLIVILDDETVVPLTRGFSGIHDRQLDQIVVQIRDYLGMVAATR